MAKIMTERTVKPRSLTHRVISAFFWQSGVAAASMVVRAVILILLARHLPPGDFGIVAAAMVVSNITQAVTQIGVAKALVQRPVLLDHHVRTGFLATVLMGVIATVLLAFGAPLFAAPFNIAGLEPVIRFLSVLMLLNSITAVPMALTHRAMKFRISSGIELLSFLFGYGAVGMILALAGFGVWSLAIAEVSHAGSRMLLYMYVERPPLGLRWNRMALKELFDVGSGYSAGQIGNLVATQVDYFLVGRMLGATALGLYSRAYQFLMLPAQLIGTATQAVLFPSLASIQDQPKRVARAFLRATGVVALTTLPISGVLMILAPELVDITLGPRWQGMVVPFQILIATLLFRTSYKIADSVSLALGSMVQRAVRQWIYAGAVAAGAWLGARWGLPGVSAGVGAAVVLNFAMMLQLAMQVTGVSAYRIFATHVAHAFAAVPIVVTVWASVSLARLDGLHDLLVLALGLGTGALMAGLLWWRCRWIFGADGEWAHDIAAARLAPLQAKFRA
jgi:PST family polysaccharide transporter